MLSQSSPQANYTLDGSPLQITQETKYPGFVIQSDLKLTHQIYTKISKARQQLGAIKRTLFKAPKKANLLAYIGLLCRPHVEYAAVVWNSNLEYITYDIEIVQKNAVRFTSGLKGRDSITTVFENLDLETLAAKHEKTWHSLLLKILTNEENHNSLINAYKNLMDTRTTNMPTTRAAARGDPHTIYAKTSTYHNGFLPRTVHKLKANNNKVSVNQ